MWKPEVTLSQQEVQIVNKVRKAKLFVLLREHWQELFDEAFQEELASLSRKAERGQPKVGSGTVGEVIAQRSGRFEQPSGAGAQRRAGGVLQSLAGS